MTRVYKAEILCYWSVSYWWGYSTHKLHCQAFLSPSPIWHENLNNNPGIFCDTNPSGI